MLPSLTAVSLSKLTVTKWKLDRLSIYYCEIEKVHQRQFENFKITKKSITSKDSSMV